MKLRRRKYDVQFPMLKLVFVIVLSQVLLVSCEQKIVVNQDASSDINDAEWQKGKKLFLETCGVCHQVVKKDEIFKRYGNSIAGMNADQKVENLRKLLAGDKHRFVKDDRYSNEELEAIVTFIVTPQKTGIEH